MVIFLFSFFACCNVKTVFFIINLLYTHISHSRNNSISLQVQLPKNAVLTDYTIFLWRVNGIAGLLWLQQKKDGFLRQFNTFCLANVMIAW